MFDKVKHQQQKKHYLKKTKENVFQTVVLGLLAVALTVLFVVGAAPEIMAGVCIALTCSAIAVAVGKKLSQFFFGNKAKEAQSASVAASKNPHNSINSANNSLSASNTESLHASAGLKAGATQASPAKSIKEYDYFNERNRMQEMKNFKGEPEKCKQFLMKEIEDKIKVFEPMAGNERIDEKTKALVALKLHLVGMKSFKYKGIQCTNTYISRQLFFEAVPDKVFTNVWKSRTDTEDLFAATFKLLDDIDKQQNPSLSKTDIDSSVVTPDSMLLRLQ